MKIIHYKNETLPEGVLLCYEHRLYVPNWSAVKLFRSYLDGGTSGNFEITVGFEDDQPIAWCLKFQKSTEWDLEGVCWRFTKPDWRYKGIGRKLWVEIGKGRTLGIHKFLDC